MPDAKRPDPKRRVPGRPGPDGSDAGTGTAAGQRRAPRTSGRDPQEGELATEPAKESIAESIAAAAARQSEQRLGTTARRAAILAAVVCVLTLTIAGPVRTYFAQRTEMKQLAADRSRKTFADRAIRGNEDQAGRSVPTLQSQARERLGFVMPGETPYQVQLPPGAAGPSGRTGCTVAEDSVERPVVHRAVGHDRRRSPQHRASRPRARCGSATARTAGAPTCVARWLTKPTSTP